MADNNEYDDEWIEDAPVYRSLSIAPPDDLAQPSFDSANSTTYDGDEEQTVYRSLCVQAPMAPPSLGGLPMPGDLGMGMMSLNQKSSLYGEPTINPQLKHPAPMNAPPKSLDAASLQLSGVPISTSFLDPCHVYVYGDPAQIVHQINQELDDSGIDYVFKSQKAKVSDLSSLFPASSILSVFAGSGNAWAMNLVSTSISASASTPLRKNRVSRWSFSDARDHFSSSTESTSRLFTS